MLVPEAVVVTETQCLLCGSSSVCGEILVGSELVLSFLDDSSKGAATYNVFVITCRCDYHDRVVWLSGLLRE